MADEKHSELIGRIGRLTRALSESIRELGLGDESSAAGAASPKQPERAGYSGARPEQSAASVPPGHASDGPLPGGVADAAGSLGKRWDAWFEAPADLAEARALVNDTRGLLRAVHERAREGDAHPDDSGAAADLQVSARPRPSELIGVLQNTENELVDLLLEHVPKTAADRNRGDEPATNAALLETLGF